MKKLLLIFILILSFSALGQTDLPSNFIYKRETGQTTGIPSFLLSLSTDSITYDALKGNSFEALCALVQPERDKFGLMFWNAKNGYALHLQKTKGVSITIGDEKFDIKDYTIPQKRAIGRLKIEAALIIINKDIFYKLVKANDVTIRVGKVLYNLDQDNIDAFHYFGEEIEKDLKRRKQ